MPVQWMPMGLSLNVPKVDHRWVYSDEARTAICGLQIGPAAGLDQTHDRNDQRTCPDQDELQHFIEDGGAQAAERDVNRDSDRRHPDAEVDVPARGRPS